MFDVAFKLLAGFSLMIVVVMDLAMFRPSCNRWDSESIPWFCKNLIVAVLSIALIVSAGI